jgi:hypothetical protein
MDSPMVQDHRSMNDVMALASISGAVSMAMCPWAGSTVIRPAWSNQHNCLACGSSRASFCPPIRNDLPEGHGHGTVDVLRVEQCLESAWKVSRGIEPVVPFGPALDRRPAS